jgi:protein involved in polysaccharide export with SLBB domain
MLLGSSCKHRWPNYAPFLPAQMGHSTNAVYCIQSGDVLAVKFAYDTNLDEQVVVRPDGKISLQLIEEVTAEGKQPSDLAKELADKYGKFLREPKVAVIVRDFAGMKVYVGGEVYSPRMLALNGQMTALQAVLGAGGFNDKAKLSSVIVVSRGEHNLPLVRTVNLKQVLAGDPNGQDPLLRPFDVVYVPKTFIANANKFVEQYIEEMIPGNLSSGFSYTIWRGTQTPP